MKLRMTIEVDVNDMTEAELRNAGFYEYPEEDEGGPVKVKDYKASKLAECLMYAINSEDGRADMFGGSDVFVTMGDAQLIKSEFCDTINLRDYLGRDNNEDQKS